MFSFWNVVLITAMVCCSIFTCFRFFIYAVLTLFTNFEGMFFLSTDCIERTFDNALSSGLCLSYFGMESGLWRLDSIRLDVVERKNVWCASKEGRFLCSCFVSTFLFVVYNMQTTSTFIGTTEEFLLLSFLFRLSSQGRSKAKGWSGVVEKGEQRRQPIDEWREGGNRM